MRNPSTCYCACNKAWKIDEYLEIKNCFCKKRLFGKLVLNTTETSRDDKKHAKK